MLKQHKKLFTNDTKFRILISNAEEATEYETGTAYTGSVQGTLIAVL